MSVVGCLFVNHNSTILFSVVTSAKRVSARQQTRGSVGTNASAGPDTREGSAKTKVSFISRFQMLPMWERGRGVGAK